MAAYKIRKSQPHSNKYYSLDRVSRSGQKSNPARASTGDHSRQQNGGYNSTPKSTGSTRRKTYSTSDVLDNIFDGSTTDPMPVADRVPEYWPPGVSLPCTPTSTPTGSSVSYNLLSPASSRAAQLDWPSHLSFTTPLNSTDHENSIEVPLRSFSTSNNQASRTDLDDGFNETNNFAEDIVNNEPVVEPLQQQQHINDDDQDNLSIEVAVREILKNQRHMNKKLGKLEERVASLETGGLGTSTSSSDVSGKEKQRLPSQLSNKVAQIYSSLPSDKQFKVSERISSAANKEVVEYIKEQILLEKENDYGTSLITAIRRYFDSRKRIARESKPDQGERVAFQDKQRKLRARRQRIFDKRKKQLRGKENKYWEKLSIEYMSFESSDDEQAITVHHIPWRSKKMNDFIKILDERTKISAQNSKHFIPKAKERKDGLDAQTLPPTNAPKWSIDENWIEANQRENTQDAECEFTFEPEEV